MDPTAMKRLLLALTLFLLPSAALAQCNGVFPANTICGKLTTKGIPGPVANSALTGVPGGSPGQVQYNNTGVFGGLTNTQLTADINTFTSTLSGATPSSGGGTVNFLRADGTWAAVPLSVGATTIASGTTEGLLYDNAGVLGNLATANNGIFVTSGSGVPSVSTAITLAYQGGNPANSGFYFTTPNSPGGSTTVYNGIQASLGTAIPASQQYGANGVGVQSAIVGTTQNAAGDTTNYQINGVAGYAVTNEATGGAGAVAVGILGQGGTSVANASVFGGNTVANNWDGDAGALGFNLNYIAGFEVDVNLWKLSGGADPTVSGGHAYGVIVAGSTNIAAKIANSAAYATNYMSAGTSVPWDSGFLTYTGAAVAGINLGAAAAGASQSSQTIVLNGTDGASATKTATIYADLNGALIIAPTSGQSLKMPGLPTAAGANVVCFGTGGVFTSQVSGTGCAASSIRFKQDIHNISDERSLDVITRLQPKSYHYRPETNMGDDIHFGMVAEQVETVDPDLITYETDGRPHAVKYNELAPFFAGAIRKLQSEIEIKTNGLVKELAKAQARIKELELKTEATPK